MKLFSKKIAFATIVTSLFFTACKKENIDSPSNNNTPKGAFKLELEHTWSNPSIAFELNSPLKHPLTNDTLNFTTFKYYVSNIKLKKSDGTWWIDTESYYLIDASVSNSNILSLKNIPAGTYTKLEYTLGVDSIRNVSGAQTGALSISNGMFWSWNSGYIMLKAEGTSPNATSGNFAFHFGGFKGPNAIVTTKESDFSGATLEISPNATPQVHLIANVSAIWNNGVSVKTTSSIMMPGTVAKTMAELFYNSFQFDHIHP